MKFKTTKTYVKTFQHVLLQLEQAAIILYLPSPQSSDYEHTIGGLRSEVGQRDSELSKLRDRVNNLTVTVSNLKKELGVKGQEGVVLSDIIK